MKICGQKMEVTLPIHGRERTFSEQELIAILEKHFSNEATEQATTAKVVQEENTTKAVQGPTEDEWFEVNPALKPSLFQEERKEESRARRIGKLFRDAFDDANSHL